jgi:hypothetical protein
MTTHISPTLFEEYGITDMKVCRGPSVYFTYKNTRYLFPIKTFPILIQNISNGLPIMFAGRLVVFEEN